ncbi:MAG: hypothetical protein CL693_16780 [Cellvibrionaceae bacterium]|nr:hypothetical protein [Cellvibrionaceae bacterium]
MLVGGALSALLSACVPTVTTVYDGPEIRGQLVALSSLEPVADAQVFYADHLERSVMTDEKGLYRLPAPARTQATVLMAGHALAPYQALVRKGGYGSTTLLVYGSLKMLEPEQVMLDPVVLDDQLSEIPKPTITEGSSHQLVKTLIYVHSLFGACDRELGWDALKALNVYRKLYWRYQKRSADTSTSASQLELIARYQELSQQHASRLWDATLKSCPVTDLLPDQRREVGAILNELEQWPRAIAVGRGAHGYIDD